MLTLPENFSIHLAKVQAFVYRAPVKSPVQTSFGIMNDRPAVLVRLEDVDGVVGWGEIWCNFPSVGAEYRARVLEACIAPILLEKMWTKPAQAFDALSQRLRILAIQCGDAGAIAQAIAGVDIALWDLMGKKLQQPLWKLLSDNPIIQTYASGLNPTSPETLAAFKRDEGYRAFKLKIGFGIDRDRRNLRALRDLLGQDTPLMADVNQAWTIDEAMSHIPQLTEFNLTWVEEPIDADSSIHNWDKLAKASSIPLAAGENMRGASQFDEAIESGAFSVLQPDIAKWGGFSGCIPISQRAIAQGRTLCPHWLGAGVGLVASMHLKAMVGGSGYVEVDSNSNPLRDMFASNYVRPNDGSITLSNAAGLGITPDLESVREFLVSH